MAGVTLQECTLGAVAPRTTPLQFFTQRADIDRWVATQPAVPCIAAPGDAVVMRPHVLHSSGKTRCSAHRRVIHLEYSSYDLPSGIDWA